MSAKGLTSLIIGKHQQAGASFDMSSHMVIEYGVLCIYAVKLLIKAAA